MFKTATFTIVLIFSIFRCSGQFAQIYLGVNGLTCSQCSKTVEMQVRKLGFVKDVEMNLQNTKAIITVRSDKKVNMHEIAKAVVDAGFSVRSVAADFTMNNSVTLKGNCFYYGGDDYVFSEHPLKDLNGTIKLKFIDKEFMSKSDYRKMKQHLSDSCENTTGKVFHVILQ